MKCSNETRSHAGSKMKNCHFRVMALILTDMTVFNVDHNKNNGHKGGGAKGKNSYDTLIGKKTEITTITKE